MQTSDGKRKESRSVYLLMQQLYIYFALLVSNVAKQDKNEVFPRFCPFCIIRDLGLIFNFFISCFHVSVNLPVF